MRCSASFTQHMLQSARPLPPNPAARTCAHPTKPAPLRKLCHFTEPCVELLVSSASSGYPCCILPKVSLDSRQAGGIFPLIRLDQLKPSTLINSLAALEGHVANTCATCPTAAAALPACQQPGQQQQQSSQQPQPQQRAAPSPLCYCPEFSCFLERCLELAQTNKQLGPAPCVLLLQIVSRLNYAADEHLRDSFSRFYLHLQVCLEEGVDLHPESLTPQVALAMFEAWAAMGAQPMKTHTFGTLVREHVKLGLFTPQELSRLLAAMSAIRAARPSYRPCQYDLADVCNGLAGHLQELASPHLASVATSLRAFPWPVYQCVVPLLEGTAHEAVRRAAVGTLTPPSSTKLLAAAVGSARDLNPRLGAELEAQVAGWQAQARVCTGNILSYSANGGGAEASSAGAMPGHKAAPGGTQRPLSSFV